MKGHVDIISPSQITGWAFDSSAPDEYVAVYAVDRDGNKLVEGVANRVRPDLLVIKPTDGRCAFSISPKASLTDTQMQGIRILAVSNAGGEPIVLSCRSRIEDKKEQGYQSFDDQIGDSDSKYKWRQLRLPEKLLREKRILDLGCNEGYFCREALMQGAASILGIDTNPEVINRARVRVPDANFMCGTWWNIPNDQFDVIFFLSAIHYEEEQQLLLDKLAGHLSDNGVLILECGVGEGPEEQWKSYQRHDGSLRFPTRTHLLNSLLRKYAVTEMGRSVDQSGDPVPRFVFHCTRLKPTVLLIHGASGVGKSWLAQQVSRSSGAPYQLDGFWVRLLSDPNVPQTRLAVFVKEHGNILNLDSLSREVVKQGLAEEFVNQIVDDLPLERPLVVVEGEALGHKEIMSHFVRLLVQKGAVVWNANRDCAPEAL